MKKLGEGVYGIVYLAKDTKNGDKLVAIKRQISNANIPKKEGYLKTAIREMSVLQELGSGPSKHPNIVELVDIFQLKDGSPCIVIEFVEKGHLMDLLRGSGTQTLLKPEHIKNLAYQMISGLQYLHSNFILHRDLKPDNMMLAADGTLKFIDFGMARSYGSTIPFSQNQITFVYRPPEIFFGATYYGPSADMWSIGCILAELLIKTPLFPG